MWAIGVALLILLAVDVFQTVFHPQAHGGPVSTRLTRVVWRGMRCVGDRLPVRRREDFLAVAGPLLAVLTLLVWGLGLVLGYAFIYRDFIDLLQSRTAMNSAWAAALYYSGYVASTLGLGDLVATSDWLRIVTVLQALTGFMLISVAVSYILALYRAEGEAESCAMDLATFFAGRTPSPARTGAAELDRLDRWAEGQGRRFTSVMTAYSQYPILHYFRPPNPEQSLVVQLASILRLMEALEEDERTDLSSYPSLRALREAVMFYMHGLSTTFTAAGTEEDDDDLSVGDERRLHHRRLLEHLGYSDEAP